MARSAWKGPYIDTNIVRRFDELLSFSIESFLFKNKIEHVELTKKFLQENSIEILAIAKQFSEEEPLEVWSRRSFVSPEFLGFCFLIYNGHVFQRITVQSSMVGHKFGEFAVSKRIGPNIHIAKKKKKK